MALLDSPEISMSQKHIVSVASFSLNHHGTFRDLFDARDDRLTTEGFTAQTKQLTIDMNHTRSRGRGRLHVQSV